MEVTRRNAGRSRAQKVVDKAKRANVAQGNVQNLPSTRLERGGVDGRLTLTAIFTNKGGGEPHRLDLSFLLGFPGLTDLFAVGILNWGKPLRQVSRIEGTKNLRANWFAYLTEKRLSELLPSQLNEQILAGYKSWLHQKLKADGKPIHPSTIGTALGNLRTVLRNSPGAGQSSDLVPAGPRGVAQKTDPTEVLRFDQLLGVMAAVEKEVLALRDRWEDGRRLLVQGQNFLQQGQTLCRNPREREEARADENVSLALAMLDLRYSGVIPDRDVIRADDPLLLTTIDCAIGSAKAKGYFYASARDLVSLALSLAFATIFNPDTVLKLCWKNIDRNVDRLSNGRQAVQFDVSGEVDDEEASEPEVSGTPLTKVTGDKPRSNRQLVRLLDPQASGPDQVSLNLVLDLLTAMTAKIRPQVIDHEEYGDRVFLFVQMVGQKRPKSFGDSSHMAAADIAWTHGLRSFIADNKLPAFTLKTIRATLLDYTQLINRGDLEAARQVGNHGSRVITWTHYTSNLVKRLLQEAAGETILMRERWLKSDGKLDPRKFREWTDKGCATPGWTCLDPFDSPRPNQKKGKLCTAYGECPDCPLAAARPSNPRNVMLYEALRRAIYRSVTSVSASVWRERWALVVVALDGLLASVPTHILTESRKLSVELPAIG